MAHRHLFIYLFIYYAKTGFSSIQWSYLAPSVKEKNSFKEDKAREILIE